MDPARRCPVVGKPVEHLAVTRTIARRHPARAVCPGCGRTLALRYDRRTGTWIGWSPHRPMTQLGLFPTARQGAKHASEIRALVPLAIDLARQAGERGITAENLRRAAVHRGLLTGEERGRELSYLPHVFRLAGLVNTGQRRRSGIGQSHGNLHTVWRYPGAG